MGLRTIHEVEKKDMLKLEEAIESVVMYGVISIIYFISCFCIQSNLL